MPLPGRGEGGRGLAYRERRKPEVPRVREVLGDKGLSWRETIREGGVAAEWVPKGKGGT